MGRFSENTQLSNANLSMNTDIPCQSGISDYRIKMSQVRSQAVAVCNSSAETVGKTATVNNQKDFVLASGMIVTVYFQNKNSAENPTLNVNDTGAYILKLENQSASVSIGADCWLNGATLTCQFVEVSETLKFWLILGHNVASKNTAYTVLSDNTFVYSKSQTDTKIDTEISGLSGANIQATYEGETDYINNVLTKVGKVKTVNEQEPDENGNIEIDADSTIPSMTTAEYDELTDEEKNDGHIREITDSVGTPIPFAVLNDEIKTSSNVLSAQKCFNEFGYELGSNENGYYRKWANGLLECWGKSSAISSGGNVTITLPYNFKDTNFSVITTSNGTYYNSTEANNTCVIISESQIKISNGSHNASQFSYFTIGYWK